MTFTQKVLTGLVAGVACGVFFGERVKPLEAFANGYVKLLQMTVLPYVVLSITSSLGSLDAAQARRLGLRVGAVIAGLWGVAIGFALLIPLSFPASENASFFSTAQVQPRPPFNFVDLYIPSNPFHSLANNVVPAIVLFSVILGVSLMNVPRKPQLLEVLRAATETISRATKFIVRLTPYGIFAIAAHASGTLSLDQLGRIQIYLIAYIAVALLLALWVLPGLVAALTPVPVREIFAANRNALVTAFVAADVFIILPSLMDSCVELLRRNGAAEGDQAEVPEVIIPASFNFPHSGKLLSLSFILFAAWFADAALGWAEYPQLAGAGLLSIFGSLNSAVPFLLDLFRIPADTFQLYLATGVLNARFGSLLAAVHLISVALLGAAALAGTLRFNKARVMRYLAITAVLTAGTIGGLRFTFATVLNTRFDGAAVLSRMTPLTGHPEAVVVQDRPPAAPGRVYDRILARRILRVGVFPERMPFAFRNPQGHLVGFEIEAAHQLARDLGVAPRFVELTVDTYAAALADGSCDIVMSGVPVTPLRAGQALFSRSYLDQILGFAVQDYRREEFATWQQVREAGRLRIAALNLPHYLGILRTLLPEADLVPVAIDRQKLDPTEGFDAYALPAEVGAVRTLLHPQYSIVVPAGALVKIPTAYAVAERDEHWASVVNAWIEVSVKDGTFERLHAHWVLGQSAQPRVRRMSLLDYLRRP